MLLLILYVLYLDRKKLTNLFLSLVCFLYFGFYSNSGFNSEKCPNCYGDELCRHFQNHQIRLTWFSYFLSLFNPRLTKSVFHGVFNDSVRVVIKRKFERTDKNVTVTNEGQVVLCPSVTNKNFLFEQIKGGVEEKKLWLDIKTSIEPLLLMFFQSTQNWPIPKYLGACGDAIVEEYKGEPLYNFLFSEFTIKLKLAISLLKIAEQFTFGHSDLAFYFTDFSLDNFVVDTAGEIFLIDLDSVIISNKSSKEYYSERKIHKSEVLHKHNYAFSPSDICSHYLSDHNYFTICKYLLLHPEDGLLKDIPKEFTLKEELLWLLSECAVPSETKDRFSAAQMLQRFLEKMVYDKTENL